ncbi:MAG TPA: M28 family peptidase, partial [Nocardioides sp.]|nr:M28 family peptidase [Nocardioides sp.]
MPQLSVGSMDNTNISGAAGPSRRAFLSASAATATAAIAAPIALSASPAYAAPAGLGHALDDVSFDPALRQLIRKVDPKRIEATIQRLTQFGTRHTASSQTDPVRGIGAATAWVTQQLQAIAATTGGTMTVQQQSFVQPVSTRIPVPTPITNVIATLKGTASPERFYVVTGHLDSRATDPLDFTSDAPGADDDA